MPCRPDQRPPNESTICRARLSRAMGTCFAVFVIDHSCCLRLAVALAASTLHCVEFSYTRMFIVCSRTNNREKE